MAVGMNLVGIMVKCYRRVQDLLVMARTNFDMLILQANNEYINLGILYISIVNKKYLWELGEVFLVLWVKNNK